MASPAATVQMRNPQTGGVGTVDINKLQEALADGMELAQDGIEFFNPESRGTGAIPAQQVAGALQDGLLPVGSHAHQVASTGKLESFGRGVAQGATFGLSDEIVGAVESAAGSLGLTKQDKTYEQARDESRAANRIAEEANPGTSMGGEFVGGLLTALMPGGSIGVAAKGAGAGGKMLAAAKLGGTLGAATAFGKSEAHGLDLAVDVAKGGLGGAVIGGAGSLAGQGISFAARKAHNALEGSINPHIQRAMASGATRSDFAGKIAKEKTLRTVGELTNMGIYERGAEGLPGRMEQAGRVFAKQNDVINQMRQVVGKTGDAFRENMSWKPELRTALETAADSVIGRTAPSAEQGILKEMDSVLTKLGDANGIEDLWALKKRLGGASNWKDMTIPQPINELRKVLSNTMNEKLIALVDSIGDESLKKLNGQYEALATAERWLGRALGDEAVSSNILGAKIGDNALGGIAGTMGAALGGAPGAAIGYGASTLGNAALRSTEGRLMRAEVGSAMGRGVDGAKAMLGMRIKQQAEQSAMQQAPGLIPRTVEGVKQFAQKAAASGYAGIPPQLQPMFQRLNMEPPGVAETTIRGLMPFLVEFMVPSVYQSEMNGHVMEPQDKHTAARQLRTVPGLSPARQARALSELAETGKLPMEIFAPKDNPQSMDDQINRFAAKLEEMGL